MILKLLLNTQMIWMIFMKILKNAIIISYYNYQCNPLDLPSKEEELKKIDNIFPQNMMDGLIHIKLKEIINLKDIVKIDHLYYKSRHGKTNNFGEYLLPIDF